MIHVIATIETHPGKMQEFLDYFIDVLVPKVRAEEGCLEYLPTIDVPRPLPKHPEPRENVVTIVERWTSLDTLEAHRNASHMHEYREFVRPLVARTSIQVLQPA